MLGRRTSGRKHGDRGPGSDMRASGKASRRSDKSGDVGSDGAASGGSDAQPAVGRWRLLCHNLRGLLLTWDPPIRRVGDMESPSGRSLWYLDPPGFPHKIH